MIKGDFYWDLLVNRSKDTMSRTKVVDLVGVPAYGASSVWPSTVKLSAAGWLHDPASAASVLLLLYIAHFEDCLDVIWFV